MRILFVILMCLISWTNKVSATETIGWKFNGYSPASTFYYPFASTKKIHPKLPFEVDWTKQANQLVLTGDVNGDGELEIITPVVNRVIVCGANGDELFSSDLGGTLTSICLIDLDNNGSLEIIFANKKGVLGIIDCKNKQVYSLFDFGNEIKNISLLGPNTIITQLGKVGEVGSVTIRKVVMSRIKYVDGIITEKIKEIGTYSLGADAEIGALNDSFVAIQSYASKISLEPGTYNGTSDWYSYVICLDDSCNEKWVKKIGSVSTSTNVAIADMDGNGEEEIIVWILNDNNDWGGVYILNPANGDIIHQFLTTYGLKGMAVADFNYDGKKEIVVGSNIGKVMMLDCNLNPLAQFNHTTGIATGCINDLSGDGHLEIITYTQDGQIIVLDDELNKLWNYTLPNNKIAHLITSEVDKDGVNDILVLSDKLYLLKATKEIYTPTSDIIVYSYPNPAKNVDKVTFRYHLPKDADITIDIYDISYDWVTTLKGKGDEGRYSELEWNMLDIASGLYVYIFKVDFVDGTTKTIVKRLVIIK